MTQDEIIEMARQAGWKDLRDYDSEMRDDIFMGSTSSLETFAKLVAEAEREACAKVCDNAIASIWEYFPDEIKETSTNVCNNLAKAIRARAQADGGKS